MSSGANIIAVSVGNTRVHLGRFENGDLAAQERFDQADETGTMQWIIDAWPMLGAHSNAAILLASVDDQVADRLSALIGDQLSATPYRVGEDVPIPIGRQLDPETITGVDRLLNAAAAYDRLKEACVVIDVGTAVTVDFVDGEGTFHGGAIFAGATVQLRALHEHCRALPELSMSAPDPDVFGRSTAQAMLKGVFHGIRGAVQRLVEQYAGYYEAFPTVVATGGDAALLFEGEELIDKIVPELSLMGIALAARHALAVGRSEDGDVQN